MHLALTFIVSKVGVEKNLNKSYQVIYHMKGDRESCTTLLVFSIRRLQCHNDPMKFCKITKHEYIFKFILNLLQLIEANDFSQFCSDYIGKDDKINHFTM